MELNWSTFVLEIINFLILVWILKRFLYKPVLDVIARRRAGIEQTMAEAESLRHEAQAMQTQYKNRLSDWEKEKQTAHEALRNELNAERSRRMAALEESLERERHKARAAEQQRLEELMRSNETVALEQAGQFVSRLFSRLTGPELEARLVELLLDELAGLPAQRQEALRAAAASMKEPITVTSAYPLDAAQRQALEQAFGQVLGEVPVRWKFHEDPQLMAGLRISIGPWMLGVNLQDELSYFVEGTHD